MRVRPIRWSVTRSYEKQIMSGHRSEEHHVSNNLGIIIRPDLLAAIGCANEVLTSCTTFGDFTGELLVHEAGAEDLECAAFVLVWVIINIGGTKPCMGWTMVT
jgi:hypothetical protein